MWNVVSCFLPRVTVRKFHLRLPYVSHLTGPQCWGHSTTFRLRSHEY